MKSCALTFVICLVGFSSGLPKQPLNDDESTLQLVHVVFRQGGRTPDQDALYPSNPYYNESYYAPYKYSQLTNEGKRRAYNIGTALKKRYNTFLGYEWNIDVLDVQSSDYNRTKMSAQLMLAGLWPPTGRNVWGESFVDWQPIPFNYRDRMDDKELLPYYVCPTLTTLYEEVMASPEISSYVSSRYNQTLKILTEKTGLEVDFVTAYGLYFGFFAQEQLNFTLEEWTKEVYPEALRSVAVDYYYIVTNTTALRKIIPGYHVKKIIDDTQRKINGTLSPSERKMFIYSGQDVNIITLLMGLDLLKVAEIPPYGSYILFEIHLIDGVYGVKLFYQDYSTSEPQLLKLPGCADFCPFDDFVSLLKYMLPKSDADCYGS